MLTKHHSIKVARSAAKRAAQFERQKHVRRLKKAQAAADAAAESTLEQELTFLKQMDPHVLGMRALSTKLVKSKLLPKPAARDPQAHEFPLLALAHEHGLDHASMDAWPKPQAGPEERAMHQVLSSKVLAEEIQTCLQALVALVHPAAAASDTKPDTTQVSKQEKDTKRKHKARASSPPPEDAYESDDGMGNLGMEARDADDLDAMVASGSDTDMEDSSDEAMSDEPPKRRRVSPDASMFLPSLSTGFIPSRGDDDWSDAEADFADTGPAKGPPKSMRKNRRGQRERRAIWEKKYGRHANHLKLREKEPRVSKARPKKAPLPRTQQPPRASDTSNASKPSTPTQESTSASKPLHPSWVAKQKAKEAWSQAQPRGTKIVFE